MNNKFRGMLLLLLTVWYNPIPRNGEMAEWLKAHAWKVCIR